MVRRYEPEQDKKDFLALKGPSFLLSIRPQTAFGWWTGLGWTLIVLAPTLPFTMFAQSVKGTPQESWMLYAFPLHLLATGLAIWAMVRWMLDRAEVVKVDVRGKRIDDAGSVREKRDR